MDQSRAPLFEKLLQVRQGNPASFHVPGHKSGKGVAKDAAPWFGPIMELDLTEITGLDDLHTPEGVIQEAQQLAARCFGAEHTFFLVGGSTVGNLAMILALCDRGDTLIVQRDAHKSVIHGLMLAGAKAVFIQPKVDEQSGLAIGVAPEDLEEALQRHPEAKGVLLTNPSYYGVSTDLRSLVHIAHRYGVALVVDEAHGAHFGFHPAVPESAMACGADAAVQSAHKMLHALTMGAMLHVSRSTRISAARISQMLSMVQTSSPSYPIMASLDLCRRDMAMHGRHLLDDAIHHVADLREALGNFPWVGAAIFSHEQSAVLQDPLKLALYDKSGTLSGYALRDELERRGCMIEMAAPRYTLLAFSLATTAEDIRKLLAALRQISTEIHKKGQEPVSPTTNKKGDTKSGDIQAADTNAGEIARWTAHDAQAPRISEPVAFPLLGATTAQPTMNLPIQECVGLRSAEMVIPYPPGIPILYPGEKVTREIADQLMAIGRAKGHVQGAEDAALQTLRVLQFDLPTERNAGG